MHAYQLPYDINELIKEWDKGRGAGPNKPSQKKREAILENVRRELTEKNSELRHLYWVRLISYCISLLCCASLMIMNFLKLPSLYMPLFITVFAIAIFSAAIFAFYSHKIRKNPDRREMAHQENMKNAQTLVAFLRENGIRESWQKNALASSAFNRLAEIRQRRQYFLSVALSIICSTAIAFIVSLFASLVGEYASADNLNTLLVCTVVLFTTIGLATTLLFFSAQTMIASLTVEGKLESFCDVWQLMEYEGLSEGLSTQEQVRPQCKVNMAAIEDGPSSSK